MELNKLIKNVQQWSIDRGLDKADSKKQLLKLYEEFGELASGIAKKQPGVIMDSIGDCVVVLIILAQQEGFNELDIERHDLRLESVFDAVQTINSLTVRICHKYNYDEEDIRKLIESLILNFRYASQVYEFVFEDCLEMAWNTIKDRKGKLVDGIWVKEEDLAEAPNAKSFSWQIADLYKGFDFTYSRCVPDEILEVSPEQTLDAVVEDDVVNKPSHYQGRNGLEAMEVVRQFAPCPEYIEGGYWSNIIKYILRYHKKNGVEDLKKARKNLGWLIEELEK